MSTYKVPQDVEAEDKLLGPFTLRQFIYLIIIAVCLWLSFMLIQSPLTLIFLPVTLLPALFFGLLVFLGIKNSSQPAEQYLAALVRFYFKPHKRIWNQDGAIETVKITAPPKVERQYTNNLTKVEVKSRLNNLADLMDSRGWAAKEAQFQGTVINPVQDGDDRLIALNQLPGAGGAATVGQVDIMDEAASPLARSLQTLLAQSQQHRKDSAVAQMQSPSYSPYPDMQQQVLNPLDNEVANTPQNASLTKPALNTLMQNTKQFSVQTLEEQAERMTTLKSGDEVELHH